MSQAQGHESVPPDAWADTDEPAAERAETTTEANPEGPTSGSPDRADDDQPSRLEEEGEIAADYIEELLDIADIDGDIDIEIRQGRTYVSVITEESDERLRELVGPEGKVLDSLQELVRLAVLSSTGHRSRLVLDIAGYRTDRAGHLRRLAEEAIERLRHDETSVHLEPMGAYERKIIHDVVSEIGFVSESEGEGSRRHVVVTRGG